MNETVFNPTFANDDLQYNDLNLAHQNDASDGGNREEDVYPTKNVLVDNAKEYRKKIEQAQNPAALEKASTPLTDLNPETDVSEFEERTGQYPEVVEAFKQLTDQQRNIILNWEKVKENEMDYIKSSDTITQLDEHLLSSQDKFNQGKIGKEQLDELRRAGEAKRVELWEKEKAAELEYLNSSRTVDDLNMNLHCAQDKFNQGKIGEEQLAEIRRAGEAKGRVLAVVNAISG